MPVQSSPPDLKPDDQPTTCDHWGLTVAALSGAQLPQLPATPGRVCQGTYRDQSAADLLQRQLGAAAAARPGWKVSVPAARGRGKGQR